MKKSLSIQIMLALALFVMAVPAQAASRFFTDATNVLPGENATLAFSLDNEQQFYGFQADILLPQGLEIVTNGEGMADVRLSERAGSSYSVVSNMLSAQSVRVGAFSTTHTAITGNSGELLYINVKALESFAGGTVTVSNVIFTDADDKDVVLANTSAEISNKPYVSSITLSETSLTLVEGASAVLTATVQPENAGNKTLEWSSSNAAVATVDQSGKVTAVAQGKATITVKSTDGSNVSATCEITVLQLVSGITLNETAVTLNEGQSTQLTATVTPTTADNKTLEWSSSNAAVATVDQNGKVTAVAQGKATITVKSTDGSNVSATCEITVTKLVSGITLNETAVTLNEGQSTQLTATVTPATADNKTLEWSTSNAAVATVDQNGKVTAVAQGKATITVKATDGSNVSATCEITVTKLVSGIAVSPTSLTLAEGETGQLTAIVPDDADNKTVEWSSNNTAVATVDQDGKVTAVAQGKATITVKATDGSNVSATCEITVLQLVSGITLNETAVTLNEGQSTQLTATVTPATADNKTLEWSSNNTAVATVDQNGKVTAVAQGKATITVKATDGSNVSATCEITVLQLVSGITLNETAVTLNEGQSTQLTATVTPATADNKTLEWSTSNAAVATVDQNGKVTAVAQGKATITVKSTDGSNISATCEITVLQLVSGITLNETAVTLNEGQSTQLTATVTPATADNKTLEWNSSNAAVATVDQNGKVTAVAQGKATITVKSTDGSNVSATCEITVTKLVSGIAVSPTSLTLAEGETGQLTAIVPDDADNKTVEWSSNNTAVATVDQDGKVTAVAQGKATITVMATDGSNASATCEITVVKLVTSIELNEIAITLNEGQSTQLTATVTPATADNQTLEWSTSNAAVATVDQNGKVTAVAQGKATITVKSTDGSNVSATCEITVVKPVTAIELSETDIEMIEGTVTVITARVLPEDATDSTVIWYSLDEAIATVSDGTITAIAEGETIIVAEAADGSGVKAECRVTVQKENGVSDVTNDGISVRVVNGVIAVDGVDAGNRVAIYSVEGRQVFSIQSNGSRISYAPTSGGVYVVVTPTHKIKVAVR